MDIICVYMVLPSRLRYIRFWRTDKKKFFRQAALWRCCIRLRVRNLNEKLIILWRLCFNFERIKYRVGKSNKPISLFFGGIAHTVTSNTSFGAYQQLKSYKIQFQVNSKVKRLTVGMFGLNLGKDILIKLYPINTTHIRGTKIFLQIGFNQFIIFRPELINNILFHKNRIITVCCTAQDVCSHRVLNFFECNSCVFYRLH